MNERRFLLRPQPRDVLLDYHGGRSIARARPLVLAQGPAATYRRLASGIRAEIMLGSEMPAYDVAHEIVITSVGYGT